MEMDLDLGPYISPEDVLCLYPPGPADAWRTFMCDTGSELKKDD